MVFADLSGDLDLGVTIFFVGQTVEDATSRPWLALDVGGANEIRLNSIYTSGNPGSVLAEAAGSSVVSANLTTFGSGPTTGQPALFTVRITPTELKYWRSNVLLHTAAVSSALLDTARSVSRLMARDDLDQGDMAQAYLQELLIKNRPMSDTEITAKQYALISKWGLTL